MIRIADGSLLELTYIAANMRPDDWREVACQLPVDSRREVAAAICFASGRSWVALDNGQPIAGFGISPISVAVLGIWAWGTRRMWRAVPAVTRFVDLTLAPEWYAAGVQRIEARSIVDHHAAHRWLRGLGWTETPCPSFGRDGEDFILFAQTRKGYAARLKEQTHVLQHQGASAEHGRSAGADPDDGRPG